MLNEQERTPKIFNLRIASRFGTSDGIKAAFENGEQVDNSITLSNGKYNINHTLNAAVKVLRSKDILGLLIENGAECNNEDFFPNGEHNIGRTLNIAVDGIRFGYNKEMLEFLIENGAEVSNANHHQVNTLYRAFYNKCPNDIIDVLLKYGADLESLPADHLIPNADINLVNALNRNSDDNHFNKIIDILLKHGADPEFLPENHPRKQEMQERLEGFKVDQVKEVAENAIILHAFQAINDPKYLDSDQNNIESGKKDFLTTMPADVLDKIASFVGSYNSLSKYFTDEQRLLAASFGKEMVSLSKEVLFGKVPLAELSPLSTKHLIKDVTRPVRKCISFVDETEELTDKSKDDSGRG